MLMDFDAYDDLANDTVDPDFDFSDDGDGQQPDYTLYCSDPDDDYQRMSDRLDSDNIFGDD